MASTRMQNGIVSHHFGLRLPRYEEPICSGIYSLDMSSHSSRIIGSGLKKIKHKIKIKTGTNRVSPSVLCIDWSIATEEESGDIEPVEGGCHMEGGAAIIVMGGNEFRI